MAKYFVNITNHDSSKWSNEQREKAEKYGEIIEYGFPHVIPIESSQRLRARAINICDDIINKFGNDIVALVQGEMTLTYKLVNEFKRHNITCLAATSERVVTENVQPDGSTKKQATFKFVAFREY